MSRVSLDGAAGAGHAIEILVRARYPVLAVPTHEEERVERTLAEVALRRKKALVCWTVTRGIYPHGTPSDAKRGRHTDPLEALDHVLGAVDPTLFVFFDFHPFLRAPEVVRKLRDVAHHLKSTYKTLVLVSPHLEVPSDLEKDVTVVDYPLPTGPELHRLLAETVQDVNRSSGLSLDPARIASEALVKAAQGLTYKEAENAFAKALVTGGRLTEADVPLILEEKQQIVRKSGVLEYYPAEEDFGGVGGLDELKRWLETRRLGFTERARAQGLPFPKGVLLVGVQGCGKSLTAKAVSSLWQLPLLRFDVGRVFSGTVGSSEDNMRRAIRTAEAVAPAILWIDEVEKAFSGVESSNFSDGGTTSRVFASFLTWLQEKKSPVFVITTANDVRRLPPELMRKGRLDEIFFVDLPGETERVDILRIHLEKRRQGAESLDLARVARAAEGFSGAELEQVVVAASFAGFERGRPLGEGDLLAAITETVPLSRTMAEDLATLRAWAAGRARPATRPGAALASGGRKMEL